MTKNLGFQKDAIITLFNGGNHRNTDDYVLAQKIRQLAGVEKVSVSGDPPESNFPRGGTLFCRDKAAQIQAQYMDADEQFVSLYGLKILTGRNFKAPNGKDSSTEFLINESCAKALGFKRPEDATGHLVQEGFFKNAQFFAFRSGLVAGVLADFHAQPLNVPIGAVCIAATNNRSGAMISVRLASTGRQAADLDPVIKSIEKQWRKIYPDENFNYSFYDRTIAGFYSKEQKTGEILNVAMAVAILISCIGLLGLITYMAAQRTKEIGIRKILGASVSGISLMLAKEFIYLIVLAIVIASPIAYYLIDRWLQGFAYRVNMNWWLFVMAGLSAMGIALLTIGYQALKAALANPVESLRAD